MTAGQRTIPPSALQGAYVALVLGACWWRQRGGHPVAAVNRPCVAIGARLLPRRQPEWSGLF